MRQKNNNKICRACGSKIFSKEISLFNTIFCSSKCARIYMEHVNLDDDLDVKYGRYNKQESKGRLILSKV